MHLPCVTLFASACAVLFVSTTATALAQRGRAAVSDTVEEREVIIPQTRELDRETAFRPLPKPNPKFKVTKVHEFTNTPEYDPGANRALAFERKYWEYGAILSRDGYNRQGQFFVITWINKDAPGHYTARFQYRQQRTRDRIRELIVNHPETTTGSQRSMFAVVGDPFQEYGPITSWRFTVWRGDELMAEEQSFVW